MSFIQNPANPTGEDAKRDVAQRHLGAFGFPAPYGHHPVGEDVISFNLDIVGGAVGSLCEALREGVRFEPQRHTINLLFDVDTMALSVQSPYKNGALQIKVKQPAPLMVRIPPWVQANEVKVSGAAALPRLVNGYLFIAEPPRSEFTITLPLAQQELILRYKTRRVRTRLRGDQVQQMENFGQDLTFFDPFL